MRATRPGESALLLLDVVDVLITREIDYAVVGAIAASVHGAVRASMDADVVLSLAVQRAAELARDYEAVGFHAALTRGDLDDPIPGMLRVSDIHGNRVDLLVGLRGMEPQAFSRAIRIPFQGKVLQFIGREDFIAMKVFAGGPIDMLDAKRALAAGAGSLDKDLLRRIAGKYGRDAVQALDSLLPS